MTIFKDYFFGNLISPEGRRAGFVDYNALRNSFDCILNNEISMKADDWELINGLDEESEVYQTYIVSETGKIILSKYTNELVWYSEELNLYLWGICHFGTDWSGVLTEIPCEKVR